MERTQIRFERDGAVAVLALQRPEVMNALGLVALREIARALDEVEADQGIRALVLTGSGRAFSAGADIPGFVREGGGSGDILADHFNPLILRLRRLRVPVICVVNGVAAGGGLGVALAGDIAIAGRSATFLFPFARLGLVPDSGVTWFVPRLVGAARARGMALLGEKLAAETAADWGLIWQVVDDEALAEAALAIARRLAAGPTKAYALTRAGLDRAGEQTLEDALAMEARNQQVASATDEASEGIAAMIERRPPRFAGD